MGSKILAVARAEYTQAIRSKAFLIGVLMMPIMMGGSIVAQILLKDQVDLTKRTCAIVDPTGELWPVFEAAAAERREAIFVEEEDEEEKVQKRPDIKLVRHEPSLDESREALELALSERVRDGELDGFLILSPAVFDPSTLPEDSDERLAAYHTNAPTFSELPDFLQGTLNSEVRRVRFQAADLDETLVSRLSTNVSVPTYALATQTASGEIQTGERENKARTFLVPFASMFLLFMLIMTSAPNLMNQVLEEKMLRISEVLVSAVSPFDLMMGKLVGSAAMSFTLGALYLGGIAYVLHYHDISHFVPLSMYLWFGLMLLLSILMYGSVLSALGSACSELRDAQSMMMPAMVVIMIPLFAWNAIIESPNGTVATVMTFVPTATPMVLMLRFGAPPGPPTLEVIASVILCIATTVFFVWASARVFRIGVLSQGQTPNMKTLVRWVFSK